MSSPVPQGRLDPQHDPGSVRQRLPRIAQSAVERARLTVVPRTRSDAPRVPFVALVSLVLLTGVVGLLLFNTSLQQASFATTALEQQAGTLSAREQSLRMQLADLRDPQRVARKAQRMGMVIAPAPTFLSLGTGAVAGQGTPASAEDRFPIEPPPVTNPYVAPPVPAAPTGAPAPAVTQRSTGASDTSGGEGRGRNETQSQQSLQQQQSRQAQRSQQSRKNQQPSNTQQKKQQQNQQ